MKCNRTTKQIRLEFERNSVKRTRTMVAVQFENYRANVVQVEVSAK